MAKRVNRADHVRRRWEMAKKPATGRLTERVKFQRMRLGNPDLPNDYGNLVQMWVDDISVAAEFIHLRGGESVLAGRLQGRHTQVIRVRSSAGSRAVSTDWRVTDTRRGQVFNIRDITEVEGGLYLDMLCETGVAV